MPKISQLCAIALLACTPSVVAVAADTLSWPSTLPVYEY
jgi:hypothetical protein